MGKQTDRWMGGQAGGQAGGQTDGQRDGWTDKSKLKQAIKTSKFEWTLDNIRIEKIILAPIWALIWARRF